MSEKSIQEFTYALEEVSIIGVLAGISDDLSLLDLAPWGFKAYHINNIDLQEYLKKHSEPTSHDDINWRKIYWGATTDINTGREFWDKDNLYILVPMLPGKLPEVADLEDCLTALLVLFPSDVRIKDIFHIQVFDKQYINSNASEHRPFHPILNSVGNPREFYLKYDEKHIEHINYLLSVFIKASSEISYVKTAIKFYTTSFYVYNIEMSYLGLCIAMETIIPDNEQLSYRFRRNIAVLCGRNKEYSSFIYNNANKVYTLRSKIAHASISSKSYKHFNDYMSYAMILASRMIIEMILHNVCSIVNLDKSITELGFGEKTKISDNYTHDINDFLYSEAFTSTLLPKV